MRQSDGAAAHKRLFPFGGIFPYLWLGIALGAAYLLLAPHVALPDIHGEQAAFTPFEGDGRVRAAMLAALLLTLGSALFLRAFHKLDARGLLILVIIAGVVMRFGYMLYTPVFVRGHDVGSPGGYGHYAYIATIYNTFHLPQSDNGQFYHPPIEHILCAAVARVYALLTGITDQQTVLESSRLVPCFASCASMLVCRRLFEELKLGRAALLTAMAVVAFHPTFFILSASINNDMLMVFFFLTALLYLARWSRRPVMKNMLLAALAAGLAAGTKLSGALAAVFAAVIVFIRLFRSVGKPSFPGLFRQGIAYAAIFLPLCLWYPLRNYLLFGQPINYVLPLSKHSFLYVGFRSFAERFGFSGTGDLFKNIYCSIFGDYRLWVYTVKCSLFGEFTFSPIHNIAALVLTTLNTLLIALSLAAAVWCLIRCRRARPFARFGMAAVWALLIASFIWFYVKYPFTCTMDFRYIVPTVVTGATFLGLFQEEAFGRGGLWHVLAVCGVTLTGLFCAASVLFYLL